MIRKGMVEDFERFVENELANAETSRVAKRMVSSDEGEDEENN